MIEMSLEAEHRPWPLPEGPWIMSQDWRSLLFAHWPLPVEALRPFVPAALPLDLFDGHAWLGIMPFRITGATVRFVPPVPWVSDFAELNVRTYVTLEDKPGVYFFSLDAASALAVAAARQFFHLPYYEASMEVRHEGGWVQYSSYRIDSKEAPADLVGRYRPAGDVFHARKGSLEYFLAERYCLYTLDESGQVYRGEIHHPPWPLQPAEAELTQNTMAQAQGICLPDSPPLLHFAIYQPTLIWPLEPVQI
ncbi:MAG TPA: DUF2071 domain-containing protein [Chthonomonadaceae bacterium]|nr:DUF2071 domain-containing protein [Chthonomonadaceae bacterium]